MKLTKRPGYTLIELIMTIAILAFGALGIVALGYGAYVGHHFIMKNW
jgi:prepilin-type N-terminal cleavage/methylation domain-containing protein